MKLQNELGLSVLRAFESVQSLEICFRKLLQKYLTNFCDNTKIEKKEKTHDKGKHNSIDGKLLNFLIEFPSVKKAFLL